MPEKACFSQYCLKCSSLVDKCPIGKNACLTDRPWIKILCNLSVIGKFSGRVVSIALYISVLWITLPFSTAPIF